MIITIITGGTGSECLQKSLHNLCPNISINLIINGYDDGKSTGVLRKLFFNSLGISDFRKNQILEYSLIYGKNDVYNLLNHRFTTNDANNYLINLINNINFENNLQIKDFLLNNVEYFFKNENSKFINYKDFSFMNIIYCSLLDKNNNNMEIVCKIIKKELNLKNNIYLNSNDNLILKGITQNGIILNNEESIVNFNMNNDKIIDVFFDRNIPCLNENTKNILLNSDIIIFSCGTQFSSLIPTYKTLFFKETIKQSNAYKFLILNCNYDNDITNYSGDDLLNKINEYISLDDIQIIISDEMNKNLFPNDSKYKYINIPMLIKNDKHDGNLLWKYIFKNYFKKYYNKNYIFDYDDTLYNSKLQVVSNENLELLKKIKNKIIVTNNCISNLIKINDTKIYSNIGNILNYLNSNEILNYNFILNENDLNFINQLIDDLFFQNILDNNLIVQNRKNVSISIKPIKNRKNVLSLIKLKINDSIYDVIESGNTTIEFLKKGLKKRNTFVQKEFLNKNYTYISDKNDIEYSKNDELIYFEVNSLYKTNCFLKSIIINQKYDFCIIVGGINKRMNINYPKCLFKVNNEIVLNNIINKILPYANNIIICANNYYKEEFLAFENNLSNTNVTFIFFNSIDNLQLYPKGNGETIYQLLNSQINLTKKIFILWGDIFIENNMILEEMYNYDKFNNFLIPTMYEKNPYTYLILNNNNNITDIKYRNETNIDFGYHDQCIFLCDTQYIKNNINKLFSENYEELNFLNIIKYIDDVHYYETKYKIKTFNTIDEINTLF
jgi:2-phospho-L-lactate transferase/gluconeogenesis factor (CofD/UPF0052 family)